MATPGWALILLAGVYFPAVLARHTYIIGGSDAPVGAWPWQGSIQYMFGDQHVCGAAILSKDWIITAAHCVANSPFAYHLVTGLHNLKDWNQGHPTKTYFHSVQKHDDFTDGRYDIAVIELETTLDLSDEFVGVIDMVSKDADLDGHRCYVTGWGATKGESPEFSDVLQEAVVAVMPAADCKDALGEDRIFDDHICAFKAGICKGDSGSPLVCKDLTGDWKLAGIASWATDGCSTDKPSVFSRISYFRDWIRSESGL